jgi:3-dehydroquinate synthetase
LHGEAVSIGMVCAARLALRLGRIDETFVRRQRELLQKLGLPTDVPNLDPDALIAAMHKDKKVENAQVRFVLPTRLGHVETVGGIDLSLARAALIND